MSAPSLRHIRPLDPVADLPLVAALFAAAPDYWLFADKTPPTAAKAAAFFADTPPGCDLDQSHHFGLFLTDHLVGVAQLSIGFPAARDAYIGLMLLAPSAQNQGHGVAFLTYIEHLARARHAPNLFLAVMQANPRGRAFWQRHGFAPTGFSRIDAATGHAIHRMMKPL